MEAHAARFEYILAARQEAVCWTVPGLPRRNRRPVACAKNLGARLAPFRQLDATRTSQPTHRSRKSIVSFAPLGRGLSGGLFLRPGVLRASRAGPAAEKAGV